MEFSLTIYNVVALFFAMSALAIVPDSSATAVVARSMSSGMKHAAVIIVGIAAGDYLFIIIAIYGLASLADTMGALFDVLKYLGGGYLIVLGGLLWKPKPKLLESAGNIESSWIANFLTGFFITLGDPKAILFYMSFLSAFLDVTKATIFDTLTIMLLVTIVLFSAKLGYAYMGVKARLLFNSQIARHRINIFSGSVMMVTGLYLIIKI